MTVEIAAGIVLGGWILSGFYGIGLKWSDTHRFSSLEGYENLNDSHSLLAYLLMFLGGPVSIGFWIGGNQSTLISSVNKS